MATDSVKDAAGVGIVLAQLARMEGASSNGDDTDKEQLSEALATLAGALGAFVVENGTEGSSNRNLLHIALGLLDAAGEKVACSGGCCTRLSKTACAGGGVSGTRGYGGWNAVA